MGLRAFYVYWDWKFTQHIMLTKVLQVVCYADSDEEATRSNFDDIVTKTKDRVQGQVARTGCEDARAGRKGQGRTERKGKDANGRTEQDVRMQGQNYFEMSHNCLTCMIAVVRSFLAPTRSL